MKNLMTPQAGGSYLRDDKTGRLKKIDEPIAATKTPSITADVPAEGDRPEPEASK